MKRQEFSMKTPSPICDLIQAINGVGCVMHIGEDNILLWIEDDDDYELGRRASELEEELGSMFMQSVDLWRMS